MNRYITRSIAAAVIAAGAVAASAVPSMAATQHITAIAAGQSAAAVSRPAAGAPPTTNETRTDKTARNAWNTWDKSGADVGAGAAGLISSAFFGIPAFILDTVQNILRVF
jgi:hypothetical protein